MRTGILISIIFLVAIASLSILNPAYGATYAAMVVDSSTGRVMHAENEHRITYPASLTKMMTLYLMFEALENGRLKINKKLKVSKLATQQPPTKLHLKAGSTILVSDVIMGLLTKSANDAAVVAGEALGGSETNFAKMMTLKARKLGMNNTTFRNASGLPNRNQVTTAHDMVVLSRALHKHFPRYYNYFKTRVFKFRGQLHNNHNHLLGKVQGVDGIKTGFINDSGWNLAASAVRNGKRIFAVVLGGKSRVWRDSRMTKLINDAYAGNLYTRVLVRPVPGIKPQHIASGNFGSAVSQLPTPVAIPDSRPSLEENCPFQAFEAFDRQVEASSTMHG